MADDNSQVSSDGELADRVARIWRDVLNAHDRSAQATFFDLGGQSIAAVRIAGRVEDELGIQVDVGMLFEDSDLDGFTRHVRAMAGQSDAPAAGA